MSPASKAKSKDKKAGKDPQKASVKPSGLVNNMGSGTPVSGYNPLLGKFHTIETAPYSSLQVNGRFRNIDEDDYSGSSGGNGMEYDTLSNNGSWSGESEDHKDKTNPLRQEAAAAAAPDSDKREKIRQKNERKHQRQKERRALELHERCNGFLMSRKLESLAQQLVSMGFSQERATMALISNEGKMEESVSWLFEGGAGEEAVVDTTLLNKEHLNLDAGNLKIDISDELARIADMEIRYKCSRQEVERAIVTCEGDLDKAADTLRLQKQVSLSSPSPKPDETGDPPTLTNDMLSLPNNSQNSLRLQPKPMPSTLLQQKRDDKDFNYTKAAVATNGVIVPLEPGSKNVQVLRKPQSKVEWTKSQQQQQQQIVTPVDKRNQQQQQVSSYSLSSQLQVVQAPPAKAEARYTALGSEIKNLQLGLVKEPVVVVMQRPQSANAKQVSATSISSSSPPNAVVAASSGGWYPNHVELVKPNGIHSGLSPHIVPSTRNSSVNNMMSSSNQLFSQLHYQQQYQQHPPQYVSNNNGMMMGNGMWNRMGGGSNTSTNNNTPTLAVASSLGLFTGMGSNGSSGSSSPVDWKTGGSMVELDYANIDWSLDRSSRPNSGMWNAHGYDAYTQQGLNARSTTTTMRPLANNMSSNVQDGRGDNVASSSSSSGETSAAGGGAREWSSPFEEKDIFSLPRQFVFSPSL